MSKLSTKELVELIRSMSNEIENGDSYGGRVEYEALPEKDTFEVSAAYRTGNSTGQGGMVVVDGSQTDHGQ